MHHNSINRPYQTNQNIINNMDKYHNLLLDFKSITQSENFIITAKINSGEISSNNDDNYDNYDLMYHYIPDSNNACFELDETITQEIENTFGINRLDTTVQYSKLKFKPNEYDTNCNYRESEELSFVFTIVNNKIEGLIKFYNYNIPYGFVEYDSNKAIKISYIRNEQNNKSTIDKAWIKKICSYVVPINYNYFNNDSIILSKLILDNVVVNIEHKLENKADGLTIIFNSNYGDLIKLNFIEHNKSIDILMDYGKYVIHYIFQNESYAVKVTKIFKQINDVNKNSNLDSSLNLEISLHFKASLTKFLNALHTEYYDKYINITLIDDIVNNCKKLLTN